MALLPFYPYTKKGDFTESHLQISKTAVLLFKAFKFMGLALVTLPGFTCVALLYGYMFKQLKEDNRMHRQ